MKEVNRNQTTKRIALTITATGILCLGAIFWPRPAALPPSISVVLLDYTNRVGPYARLAITNRSESPITLNSTCLVQYSAARKSADRHITSIEASNFRITRLLPGQGFVQEIFVFPASESEWQFECEAAYSSTWFKTRLSVESWLRKHFRFMKPQFAGKAWHQFTTKWFVCPP